MPKAAAARNRMATRGGRGGALILMATYGEGHRRAALAVAEQIAELAPGLGTSVVDFFERVNPTVNRWARTLYVGGVRHTPALYGAWYRSTQRIREESWVQRRLDRFGLEGLARLLADTAPRVVLSTFPIPAGVLSLLRRLGRDRTPSAVAVTDFTVHSQWLHSGIDRYYVATSDLARETAARGIAADRIVATGIPVDAAFARAVRRPRPPGTGPRVMIMGGAYGMLKDSVHLAERIAALPQRPRVRVMAGHDRTLLGAAQDLERRLGSERVVAQPFTSDVAGLMADTDLLVTKAGGLTLSEGLAMGLPMVIHRPIPGQEHANVTYLAAHGAVRVAPHSAGVVSMVAELLADEPAMAALAERSRRLGRPWAARAVAADLLNLMEHGPEASAAG
jgi:processive 1,2-diacylglycerol beta-glucosyltransferase